LSPLFLVRRLLPYLGAESSSILFRIREPTPRLWSPSVSSIEHRLIHPGCSPDQSEYISQFSLPLCHTNLPPRAHRLSASLICVNLSSSSGRCPPPPSNTNTLTPSKNSTCANSAATNRAHPPPPTQQLKPSHGGSLLRLTSPTQASLPRLKCPPMQLSRLVCLPVRATRSMSTISRIYLNRGSMNPKVRSIKGNIIPSGRDVNGGFSRPRHPGLRDTRDGVRDLEPELIRDLWWKCSRFVYVTCLTMIQSPIVPVIARMNKNVRTLRRPIPRHISVLCCVPVPSMFL